MSGPHGDAQQTRSECLDSSFEQPHSAWHCGREKTWVTASETSIYCRYGRYINFRLEITHQIQQTMFALQVTVKKSEYILRLYVADGRGVVGAHRRAANCVAHGLSGREGGTAPAQRHGGCVAGKDGHVIWWRWGRWYLVSGSWKLADGDEFPYYVSALASFSDSGLWTVGTLHLHKHPGVLIVWSVWYPSPAWLTARILTWYFLLGSGRQITKVELFPLLCLKPSNLLNQELNKATPVTLPCTLQSDTKVHQQGCEDHSTEVIQLLITLQKSNLVTSPTSFFQLHVFNYYLLER